MDIAATVVLLLTVVAGVAVLGMWAEPVRTKVDRRSIVFAGVHVAAALAALTLWLVFLVGRGALAGWLGFGLLALTIGLGVSTLVSSRVAERRPTDGASPKPVPLGTLVVHGGAAALAAASALVAVVRR